MRSKCTEDEWQMRGRKEVCSLWASFDSDTVALLDYLLLIIDYWGAAF
jgi:hypothetical protein